jgi:hypothetical protein
MLSYYLISVGGTLGWWDLCLHGISGILLVCAGLALYERFGQKNTGSPGFTFLFALSFKALGGVLWEIYEFSVDQLFRLASQGGNIDTMTDLMADLAGGFLAAAWIS